MVIRPAAFAAALALAACAPRTTARPEAGRIVLRHRGPADAVVLRGSMTGWRPVSLDGAGADFRLSLALPPGRYEYRLEVHHPQNVEVVLPDGAERVDDGFGGSNAVLRVP